MSKPYDARIPFWKKGRFRRLVRQGSAGRDARDWRVAKRSFEAAVRIWPNAAAIWVQLGHAQQELGELAAAHEAYSAAERMSPNDADIQVHLGHVCKALRRFDEVRTHYASAIAFGSDDEHARDYVAHGDPAAGTAQPGDPDAMSHADQARDAGRFEAAAEFYRQAAQAAPNPGALVQLGNCLKEIGRYGAAERAYLSAAKLTPDDGDCFLQLGHLMKLAGKPRFAEYYYAKAADLDPIRPDALIELEALNAQARQAPDPPVAASHPPPARAESPRAAFIRNDADLPEATLVVMLRLKNALTRRRT